MHGKAREGGVYVFWTEQSKCAKFNRDIKKMNRGNDILIEITSHVKIAMLTVTF